MSKQACNGEGKGYFKPRPEDLLMFLDGELSGLSEMVREGNLKLSCSEGEKEDAAKTKERPPEEK